MRKYGVCMYFVCLFVTHACLPARCSFEGKYFEQVLCHGLWIDFDNVFVLFSEGITLLDGLETAHFRVG